MKEKTMTTHETHDATKNPLAAKFPDLAPTLHALSWMDGSFGDVPEGRGAIAVMGEAGDTKHIWDKNKPAEVEAARTLFDSLTRKGYRAFRVIGKEGDQGEQMRSFDSEAERMIMVPQMQGG
jgi:hypothetical protein